MNRIETGYVFPEPSDAKSSYFEDYETDPELIRPYGFRSIPECKALLSASLGASVSPRDLTECAKVIFRNRPESDATIAPLEDRKLVDFIYHF